MIIFPNPDFYSYSFREDSTDTSNHFHIDHFHSFSENTDKERNDLCAKLVL